MTPGECVLYVHASRRVGDRVAIALIGTGRRSDGDAPLTEPEAAPVPRDQARSAAMRGADPASTAAGHCFPFSGKKLAVIKAPAGFRQNVASCGLVARTSTERKCRGVADHRY
jgi:hypothetical protein